MRVIWFALTALAVTAIIGVGVAAVWGVGKVLNLLSPVLWPLAIVFAFMIAYTVNVIERNWRTPKQRRLADWRTKAG